MALRWYSVSPGRRSLLGLGTPGADQEAAQVVAEAGQELPVERSERLLPGGVDGALDGG